MKGIFGPYVATSVYNRLYRTLGYEVEAQAVADAAARGDRQAIGTALSDELVDDVLVLGDADAVVAKVKEYVANGVTTVAIAPLAPDLASAEATFRAVADRWRS